MKPADPIRPSSRRAASGAWNRLKPVRDDTLETYGLPSKGETRLNDFKTQEVYYNRIVERYMKFCASSTNGDDLDKQFASLSLHASSTSLNTLLGGGTSGASGGGNGAGGAGGSASAVVDPREPPVLVHVPTGASLCTTTSASTLTTTTTTSRPGTTATATAPASELPAILAALRKLREAITATARTDPFAQRAYIFNIHAALLCRDSASYTPALASLLTKIHPRTPLTSTELHEYVGYLILDLACRQGDIAGAHQIRVRYAYKDRRVELVLKALVADNWVLFWKMKRAVDGYQRRIMEYAEQGMRVHALKCLGRGYMSAERRFVERCADRKWDDLVADGVGWELVEMERVVIRRPRAK